MLGRMSENGKYGKYEMNRTYLHSYEWLCGYARRRAYHQHSRYVNPKILPFLKIFFEVDHS